MERRNNQSNRYVISNEKKTEFLRNHQSAGSSPGADKARVTWWKDKDQFLLTVDNSCFVIDWLSCLFVNYYHTVLLPIMQNKLYHYTFEMIHTTSNYRLCVCCFYVKTGFQFCPVLVIFQKIVLVYFSFCESGMSTITYTSQF